MKPVTPFLRPSGTSLPTAAGWLPHPSPSSWLAEAVHISRRDPGTTIQIFPTPTSLTNRSPSGALLFLAGNHLPPDQLFQPHTIPLGEPFPGVFIPTNATIVPSLTPEEITRGFPYPIQFLHPSIGLCGFHPEDAIDPVSLLAPPTIRRTPWNLATPAPPEPPPLHGISLTLPLSKDEPPEINPGHATPNPPANPPQPPNSFLRRTASSIGSLGAETLRRLGSSDIASRLHSWSQQINPDIERLRDSEISRLLCDLANDPRKAMRRAMPLVQPHTPPTGPFRPRSARLPFRPKDWNPHAPPGKHQRSDRWGLTPHQCNALEAAYRRAASLEASAGHWIKAARIYGELLGDWPLCASMLEKASLWHDAALLHRDRCHNHQRAAACFESAGAIDDAVKSWLAAGFPLPAADLLTRIGRPREARDLYEHACSSSGFDPILAASILEQKLHRPGEAISLLRQRWCHQADAAAFSEFFAMLSRHDHHHEALATLAELTGNPSSHPRPTAAFLSSLRTIASSYPQPSVRSAAANLALHTAARYLSSPQPRPTDASAILLSLHAFAPDDPLLRDDARRFLSTHYPAAHFTAAHTESRQPSEIITPPSSDFMETTQWFALSSRADRLSAAGLYSNHAAPPTTVVWHSSTHETTFPPVKPSPAASKGLNFVSTSFLSIFHLPTQSPGSPSIVSWHSHTSQNARTTPAEINQLQNAIAIAPDPHTSGFITLCLKSTGSLVAEYFDERGSLTASHILPIHPDNENHQWLAAAHHHSLWIAHGHSVWCFQLKEAHAHHNLHTFLPHPITSLTTPGLSRQNHAAATDSAGHLWMLTPRLHSWGIDLTHIPCPSASLAAFTNDGSLCAITPDGGLAFAPGHYSSPARHLAFPQNTPQITAACPTGPHSISFLSSSGTIFTFIP
jgi:tetratricopeptide (TPR) repeat protein